MLTKKKKLWKCAFFSFFPEPLGAPSDVRFGSILDRSLLVSWQPLACEESPTQIIEYLIYYCSVNSSQICYGKLPLILLLYFDY